MPEVTDPREYHGQAQAVRRGKGSSLWNAVEAIRDGKAHAAVSAGNSGALMAISKLILRMAADLERPALVASWPSSRGATTVRSSCGRRCGRSPGR